MNTDEIHRSIGALSASRQSLENSLKILDGSTARLQAEWRGADRNRWHDSWQVAQRPQLVALVTYLLDTERVLRAQLEEQKVASSASASTAPWEPRDSDSRLKVPSKEEAQNLERHHSDAGRALDRAKDMALLSKAAYGHADSLPPPGYREVTRQELIRLGLDPNTFSSTATGFGAKLFQADDGSYVLAFRGSDAIEKDTMDWVDNYLSAQGVVTPQERQAVALAKAVDRQVGGDGLTFTGVSLGGGLAALASVATDSEAVTFNARGASLNSTQFAASGHEPSAWSVLTRLLPVAGPVHQSELLAREALYNPGLITAYNDRNDFLTAVQSESLDGYARAVNIDPNTALGRSVEVITGISPGNPYAHDVYGIVGAFEAAADDADRWARLADH